MTVRSARVMLAAAGLVVVALLTSACDSLPALPANPFRSTPTPEELPTPTPEPPPTAVPTPTPVPFRAYWVKNHRLTEMWSGPEGQAGVVSFGTTSQQFCWFQVVQPQSGDRLYVLNPHSKNFFWIDANAVGPVPEAPVPVPGPKPDDQNCGQQVYQD